MTMGLLETMAWGVFGGIGAEAVVLFALRYRHPHDFPYWLRSWEYYLFAGGMAVIGGVIALAYARSGNTMNPIMAIQIGASAPLLLRKFGEGIEGAAGGPNPDRVD
jgi:hypothetical protein